MRISFHGIQERNDYSLQFDVQTCKYTKISTHWDEHAEHTDSYSRLYFITAGRGRFQCAGKLYHLHKRRCYLVPAKTPIKLLSSPGMCQFWLHFTASIFYGLDIFSLYTPPVEVVPADSQAVFSSFRRLTELSGQTDFIRAAEQAKLLLELLMPFLHKSQVAREPAACNSERFRHCLDYIDRYLHRDIQIEELADLLTLNTNYFSNIFSRHFGTGPKRYILNRRIQKAMQLLWSTDEPIKQIAASLGFSELSYFYRSFKAICGIPPGAYRRGRNKMVRPS